MERVNVVETNTTKFLEDMAQIYAQSAFADWVPGVVTLNGPMVLPDPVTVPYLVEGVPDDCTATIESDLTSWFDKTTDIEEGEQILLNVAPIDPGHYTIALYATAANGARTLKNYLSIEVAI